MKMKDQMYRLHYKRRESNEKENEKSTNVRVKTSGSEPNNYTHSHR